MERDQQFDHREIDEALADFFLGCNIPFVIAESQHFKNFIHKLNPAYNVPTRKTLSTSLLDARFREFQQSIVTIGSTEAVLLLDGWKNSAANTKNVVGMLRIEDKKYGFLKSWNFSNTKETGRTLCDVVNESINLAREKYNLNIYVVITDNASNMMLMGRLVDIWHVTCSSHSANLLSKSVSDQEFSSNVNKLLKEFKNPALESQLIEVGGCKIILIGDTRWCSHRDAFRVALRNLPFMQLVMQNQEIAEISDASYRLLFDPNFVTQLTDHILMLDSICELVNVCQKANWSLATAIELWLKLNVPANNNEHRRLIEQRINKAINPIGLAANLLHNIYQGIRFSNNDRCVNMMNEFFQRTLNEEGMVELELYKNRDGFLRTLFQRQFESTIVFWKAAKLFYPTLSNLALKLQYLCASTAQLERLFSEWSYVHDTKRNRLTADRSAKLVALYYSMRFNDNALLQEMYQDQDE